MNRKWIIAALMPALLAGCATTTREACVHGKGGLCVSSREIYGATRNRDQINPDKNTLKAQQEAAKLIGSPPSSKDELPNIDAGPGISTADTVSASEGSGSQGNGSTDPAALLQPPHYPRPLITQPRVIRIWIAPYQGPQGNLHFPGLVYSIVTPQQWAFGDDSQKAQPLAPVW